MNNKQKVLAILNDITGVDLSEDLDKNIFLDGLLDSMATVQMVLEIEDQCGLNIPISEMVREEWDTPNKIINKVDNLK